MTTTEATVDTAVLRARANEPATAQLFSLARLHESPLNPRRHIPEVKLDELAESMRLSGYHAWLPIVARLRADGDGEIAAGHRRYRAAKRAGLTEVPVVLCEMTDEEFKTVLNFDNSHREDVHPLHESAGWQRLIDEDGWTVEQIAAHAGRKLTYVYARLQLSRLFPDAHDAFLDGKLTLNHAILISRIPDEAGQSRALRACEPPAWEEDAPIVSTRALADWIKKNLQIDLERAPFSLADASLLPSAGSCTACPHRLGNMPDFTSGEDLPDVCTKPDCYDEKFDAHMLAAGQRVTAAGGVLVSQGAHTLREGVLPQRKWHQVGDGATGSKPALIVEGPSRGREISVMIEQELPLSPPPPPAPRASSQPAKRKSKEELASEKAAAAEREAERKREEARRAEKQRQAAEKTAAELATRKRILDAVLEKVKWPPKPPEVRALLDAVIRDFPNELNEQIEAQGVESDVHRPDLATVSDSALARLLVIHEVCGDFDEWTLSHGCDALNAVAKRYGVDAAAIRAPRADAKQAAKAAIATLPTLADKRAAKKGAKPAPAKKAKPAAKKKGGKK